MHAVPWANASGVKLHYEVSGRSANSIVLLHELGGTLRSWDPLVQLLGDDFRVLRCDLRGAGQSDVQRQAFGMADHARDLEAVIADAQVLPPLLVVGAAAGAAVAVTFAAQHPTAVCGIVLCAPALCVTAERRRYLAERSDCAARDGMAAVVDQTLDQSFPSIVVRDRARYDAYRLRFLQNDPISYGLSSRALAESVADTLAPSISCPCLLLAGRHDPLRPPAQVRAVAARFPHASVDELDSGHIMSQQAPEELAQQIRRFRDEVVPRRH